MRIALAGNPNSGKTTMYNALTGSNEKVGNWAGVTVDKKEHAVKKAYTSAPIVAVDLPGAYSMSPFTEEESITSDYVKKDAPDVIINVVDATNLSRSLFFTTQLLELGIPVVVALNKTDVNRKKRNEINYRRVGTPDFPLNPNDATFFFHLHDERRLYADVRSTFFNVFIDFNALRRRFLRSVDARRRL